MSKTKPNLLNSPFPTWPDIVKSCGGKPYTAQQLADWIFKKRVFHFSHMSNLPQKVRDNLEKKYTLRSLFLDGVKSSPADETARYFF